MEQHAAMEFLLSEGLLTDEGLAKRQAPARDAILTCLACRWHKIEAQGMAPSEAPQSDLPYPSGISTCTGIAVASISRRLRQLNAIGVIVIRPEQLEDYNRSPRSLAMPAETELGQRFAGTLLVPEACPLEEIAD